MTEVLKDQNANNRSGWESLAELNEENAGTTWEDVAKLSETGIDGSADEDTDVEDRIPVVELDLKEQAKLGRDEYNLYINQPEVFTKMQRIKQKNPKAYLNDLTKQLAQYYDPAYSFDPNRIIPSLKTLENLADMYSTLQGYGAMLRADELLERKPEDVNGLRQVFDLSSAELFLSRNEEKTRSGLVSAILQKFRQRLNGETSAEREAQMEKRHFLVQLAENYDSQNTVTESTVELARACGEAADVGNSRLSRFISNNLSAKESTDDLLVAAKIFQSIPENTAKQIQVQQGDAIKHFYEIGGLRNFGKEYLTGVILPVFADKELSHEQIVLIKTALSQSKTPEEIGKVDYTIRELLPELENSSLSKKDVNVACDILTKAVDVAKDRSELTAMSEFMLNEMIPFVTQQKSQNQRGYALRFLNGKLIPRYFRSVQKDGLENAHDETTELIEKCNTYVIPLLQESPKNIFGVEWRLADEAYTKNYEEKFTDYLRDDLFPRMYRGDAELGGLLRNTNLRGEHQIAKYEFNSVIAKINPRNLNDLLMQRRELPTGNALKLEQNRVDALAIEGVVVPDHGFIHDEHPMMHDVILAMVEYYDSTEGEREEKRAELRETIKAMNDYGAGRYGDIGAKAFDLGNYDRIIKGEVSDDGVTTRTYNVPAVDVLRRLEKNTRPDVVEKPMVDGTDWQELIDKVAENADWRNVGKLVEYTNCWLIGKQNQYGLTPAKVEAIAYAERMATLAMRNITESERVELPYDNVFKEFVRLQELIGGYEGYNEEKFEEFYSNFQRISMDADDRDLQEHFTKLQHHVLERSRDLVRYYKKNGKAEREYMMQSNSLLHELVGLTEVRDARTLRERADRMAMGMAVGADGNS